MIMFGLNVMMFIKWTNKDNGSKDGKLNENDNNEDGDYFAVIIICCILVGGLMILILGFCVFHMYLIWKGKTTRQLLKDKKNLNKKGTKNVN
jgi:hypothetical protein